MLVHFIYIFLIITAFIIGFMLGVSRAEEHERIAKQFEDDESRPADVEKGKRIIEQARIRKEAYLKK